MKRTLFYPSLLLTVLIILFVAACSSPVAPCRVDTGIIRNAAGDSVSYATMSVCIVPRQGVVLP